MRTKLKKKLFIFFDFLFFFPQKILRTGTKRFFMLPFPIDQKNCFLPFPIDQNEI